MLDNETSEARAAVLASLLRDDPIETTVPYEPFGEAGTMLPPSPEMMESLQYEPPQRLDTATLESLLADSNYGPDIDDERSITEQLYNLNEDHGHDHIPDEDDDAKYAAYDDKTGDADTPANLNEDNELPPYSIYARFWPTDKPLKYPRLNCGHKYRNEFEPNHRNCEPCWFTYMTTHKDLVEAVEEAYQKGGPGIVVQLKGKTFLHNFLKYMSTIAFLKAQQDKAKGTSGSEI